MKKAIRILKKKIEQDTRKNSIKKQTKKFSKKILMVSMNMIQSRSSKNNFNNKVFKKFKKSSFYFLKQVFLFHNKSQIKTFVLCKKLPNY